MLVKLTTNIIFLSSRNDLGGTLETGADRLKVSGILQKAVIEVNEKSTEAAAVSAITISNRLYLKKLMNLFMLTKNFQVLLLR
jgi:serine protease inhibitor